MKQHIVITLGRRKRLIQRSLSFVALLIDELPAHLVRCCQMADWFCASDRLNADIFANARR